MSKKKKCEVCGGEGFVASHTGRPWSEFVQEVEKAGFELEEYPHVKVGMIQKVPCPECSEQKGLPKQNYNQIGPPKAEEIEEGLQENGA